MNIITAMTNWETVFPAFVWCGAKNAGGINGWYLPAAEEVSTFLVRRTVINVTMQQYGGTAICLDLGRYWSSTEVVPSYSSASYSAYGCDYAYVGLRTYNKTGQYGVRAVRVF